MGQALDANYAAVKARTLRLEAEAAEVAPAAGSAFEVEE